MKSAGGNTETNTPPLSSKGQLAPTEQAFAASHLDSIATDGVLSVSPINGERSENYLYREENKMPTGSWESERRKPAEAQ